MDFQVLGLLGFAVGRVCVPVGLCTERAAVCVGGICVFCVRGLVKAVRGGACPDPPWLELVAAGVVLFAICISALVAAVCVVGGSGGVSGVAFGVMSCVCLLVLYVFLE